mgnify:FL=1
MKSCLLREVFPSGEAALTPGSGGIVSCTVWDSNRIDEKMGSLVGLGNTFRTRLNKSDGGHPSSALISLGYGGRGRGME